MSYIMFLYHSPVKWIYTLCCLMSVLSAQVIYAVSLPEPPAPPALAAKSYILIDYNTGMILSEKDPDKIVEPASLTKLMTAYVVFNELKNKHLKGTDKVRISENAWRTGGSRMYIKVNTEVSVDDLLRGMIIQSGNDASVALAEHVAGSESAFANMMNQYAQELGLTNTSYANSTGMPAKKHLTSARDMATMATAIIRNFPEYYPLYSEKSFTYNKIKQDNRNNLLWRDSSVDGMKTGYTKAAGYCLVSSAKREQMRLISVVMGTESKKARINESQKMITYGFRFYESREVYAAGHRLESARVWQGDSKEVKLSLKAPLYVTVPRGQFPGVKYSYDVTQRIIAPLAKNDKLGMIRASLNNKVIAEQTLVSPRDIGKGNWTQQFVDYATIKFEEYFK